MLPPLFPTKSWAYSNPSTPPTATELRRVAENIQAFELALELAQSHPWAKAVGGTRLKPSLAKDAFEYLECSRAVIKRLTNEYERIQSTSKNLSK